MKADEVGECIGLGAVLTYAVGVPVTWGYLFTALGGDPRFALAVAAGAFGWPLYLLGKIGVWLAS